MGIALVAIYNHVKSLQLILLKVKTRLIDLMLYALEKSGKNSDCASANGNLSGSAECLMLLEVI